MLVTVFYEYAYSLWIKIYITQPTCESVSSMRSLSLEKKNINYFYRFL